MLKRVFYPKEQTCCGQPMANSGCNADLPNLANRFVKQFEHADYIVCPSGSCIAMVRMQYGNYLETSAFPATMELLNSLWTSLTMRAAKQIFSIALVCTKVVTD
mgnify:CR=1 FL=1